LKDNGDEVVCLDKNKKEMTLNQVFEEMNLTAYELTVDMLDVHAVCTDELYLSFDTCGLYF
jgi:AMP deaminase